MKMNSILVLGLIFLALLEPSESRAQIANAGSMEVTGNEFPEAYSFGSSEARVTLRNISAQPIQVHRIDARRSGVADFKPHRLMPGESMPVMIQIPLSNSVGRSAFYFDVYGKDDDSPVFSFAVRGFVDWIADPTALKVDLGPVVLDGFERKIPLVLRPGERLRLVSALDTPSQFRVEIVDGGNAIKLHGKGGKDWREFHEEVKFKTDNALQPFVVLSLKAQSRGPVVPSSDPIDFGLVRVGMTSERIVRLERLDGEQLKLGALTAEGTPVSVKAEDCVPASLGCLNVRVDLHEVRERGAIFGKISVPLPQFKGKLTIGYSGIAIGKDTQIRDLEEDMKAVADRPVSLSSIIRSGIEAKKPLESPAPDGKGPLIKWQVANEQPIYGYEIYRSQNENGPFARLNPRIVPKLASDTDVGSIYKWRDESAESGKVYWYYIGTVYSDGRKQTLSSPQKVTVQPR